MSEPLYIVVSGQKIHESTNAVLQLTDEDIDSGDFSSFYMKAVQKHQSSYGVIKISTNECPRFWEGIEVIGENSELFNKKISQIGLPALEKGKGRQMANMEFRRSKEHVTVIDYNFHESSRLIKSICKPM